MSGSSIVKMVPIGMPQDHLFETVFVGGNAYIPPSQIIGQVTTTRKFLRSQGSGVAAGIPVWDTVQAADVVPGTFQSGTFSFPGPLEVLDGGVLRIYQAGGAVWTTIQMSAGMLVINWPINASASGSTFAGTTTFATVVATNSISLGSSPPTAVAGDEVVLAGGSIRAKSDLYLVKSGATAVQAQIANGSRSYSVLVTSGGVLQLFDNSAGTSTMSFTNTVLTPVPSILWAGYGQEIGVSGGTRILFEGGTGALVFRCASSDAIFRDVTGTEFARFGNGTPGMSISGTKVVGARNTGWTAQTAAASKADLGAAPTVGAIASWCSAVQAALTTHGLLGP